MGLYEITLKATTIQFITFCFEPLNCPSIWQIEADSLMLKDVQNAPMLVSLTLRCYGQVCFLEDSDPTFRQEM